MSLFATPEDAPFVFGAYAAHLSQDTSPSTAGEPADERPEVDLTAVANALSAPDSAAA